MTTHGSVTPDAQQKLQDRKRKRKAILAGGVVLGLGAAVTLAAWSDDVFSGGTFNTGTFEMQGNLGTDQTDKGPWLAHDEAAGGRLAFPMTLGATGLVPNETVYAPLAIRLSDDTTADATYGLTSVAWADEADEKLTGADVTYAVYSGVTAAKCNSANEALPAPWYSSVIGTVGTATAHALKMDPRTIETLCIAVTLNATTNAAQEAAMGAANSQITWQFTGTSTAAPAA